MEADKGAKNSVIDCRGRGREKIWKAGPVGTVVPQLQVSLCLASAGTLNHGSPCSATPREALSVGTLEGH